MNRDEIIEQQNAYYMAGYPSRRSENKINNEEKKSSKNNLPDIDISKYNIDKNGNVLKHETLIKPWQQNMLDLLEKNECLEKENQQLKQRFTDSNKGWNDLVNGWVKDCKELLKENKQLRERLKNISDFIQAGDLCSICKFENKCNPNECYNQNARVYTKFEVKE